MTYRAAIIAALVLLCSAALAGAADFSGSATAKDGDDLIIGGHDLRLFGVDASELSQGCDAGGSI
jgi:endonuclease YncB( thermonuclease family)